MEGNAYSNKQCYEVALELDPKHANAWFNLGAEGGEMVKAKDYSNKQCYA